VKLLTFTPYTAWITPSKWRIFLFLWYYVHYSTVQKFGARFL